LPFARMTSIFSMVRLLVDRAEQAAILRPTMSQHHGHPFATTNIPPL
jgi:hypothetical protein